MLDVLLLQNRIPVQSVIVRMEAYRNAGPFDESPQVFTDAKIMSSGLGWRIHGAVFHGMTEKLIKYRRHPTAITHRTAVGLSPR